MIASSLIAATIAATQPAPAPGPIATATPATEKKMACCEKMAKGEGCSCCKDMAKDGERGSSAGKDGHAGNNQ